jgi:predicted Zn finger-like uncharacterized protein
LFTQCSNCDTVFRLSAETLRAAGGQVRCGRCGEIFNALARLAEEAGAFPRRESALEMEMRADEILQSSPPPSEPAEDPAEEIEDDSTVGRDLARLQLIDDPPKSPPTSPSPAPPPGPRSETRTAGAETATPTVKPAASAKAAPAAVKPLTSTSAAAPPGKTAVAPIPGASPDGAPAVKSPAMPRAANTAMPAPTPTSAPAPTKAATTASAATTADTASKSSPSDSESSNQETSFEFTLPPGELDRVFVEVAPRSRSPIPAAALALSESALENLAGTASEARSQRVSGFDVSEEVRREMLAGTEAEPFADLAAPAPRPRSFFSWLGAAIVLAVLLAAQMLHENRAWLTTHAPLRGPLRSFYGALGIAVQVPANLSAYQLRQWGVTGDPAAAGTLRVRASILNTAAQLQPYPLLRVALANRFGAHIGTRDFEPAEYLGKPTVRMLAPGERADATLDIVDPGKDAEGFEIDVCLRGADQKISCAGDAAQQASTTTKSSPRP